MSGGSYSEEKLNWLIEKIKSLKKEYSVQGACELLLDDWEKETGRKIAVSSLLGVYYRAIGKKKKIKKIQESNSVVVVAEKGSEWAKIYPTVEAATRHIDGKLEKFEFFRAKPIKVGYKTVICVED